MTIFVEAITHFSDCHVDDINENDEKLKCYMHCLFHKFEHYELSREVDELDFFTTDEVTILLDMGEKCENFEYNNEHDEKCEYAFKLNKCWKFVNPEVIKMLFLFFYNFASNKNLFFSSDFSIIFWYEIN